MSIRFGIIAVTAFACGPLAAQSTYPAPFPDVATCPLKAGIKSFIIELPLGATGFASAFTPTFPPAAFAALTNPNVEVRVHITFDTTSMVVSNYTIAVPPGSPAITPATTDFKSVALAASFAIIDKIYTECYPRPAVMLGGLLTSSALIFGDQTGALHGMGFSFDPTNTTNINNVANINVFDAGTSAVVGNGGSGIITTANVSAVVAGAPSVTSIFRQTVLDGTGSASNAGAMTYQWSAPDVNIGILDPISPQTRVLIDGPAGDYPVTLTVSTPFDTATTTVTVHYAPVAR